MSTGWTWNYVKWHVDMFTLKALNKYWKKHPPLHIIAAAAAGYKPPIEAPSDSPPELPDIEE